MSEEIKGRLVLPQGKKAPQKPMDRRIVLVICLVAFGILVFLDQWTKHLTNIHIHNKQPISLIRNVLSLTYVENRGSAFGMMQGQFIIFYIITVILLGVVVFVFLRTPCTKHYIPIFGVAVTLTAGAIGNCYDRIVRGYVIDMIYFEPIDFPVFNVADIYVTLSCFMLVFLFFFLYKDEDFEMYNLRKPKETTDKDTKESGTDSETKI